MPMLPVPSIAELWPMPLYPHQLELKHKTYESWQNNNKAVMPVLPTGGGKTRLFSEIISEYDGPSAAIAHRHELVSQISLALASYGVRHDLITSKETRKEIVRMHMDEIGRSYIDTKSHRAVCSVDTLIKLPLTDPWLNRVGLGVQDEGHHVLKENKWGKAFTMLPHARWLLPTATPLRADGRGLGKDVDGYADEIILGPSLRRLINEGFLTDYRIIGVPSDIDYSQVPITGSGELSQPKLRAAVHASGTIVGDIVAHYLKFAPGKLGVTFAVDVEEATKIAQAFRNAGIPAEVVTGKTPALLRASIIRDFRARKILQLVNVDLFGEGFDLPALEVVSMARKTESFALFAQQFGRALRLMIDKSLIENWGLYSIEQRLQFISQSSKPRAIIIDHVGNVIRHGLPDADRIWSLARRERRSRSSVDDSIPTRYCLNPACMSVYERIYKACPYCGHVPIYTDRSAPELVDGDLFEYDEALLKELRGEKERIDGAPILPYGQSADIQGHVMKTHYIRQQAQQRLRNNIALWAGYQKYLGRTDSEAYRRFYFMFGIDIATAQTFGAADADALNAKVSTRLAIDNVVSI